MSRIFFCTAFVLSLALLVSCNAFDASLVSDGGTPIGRTPPLRPAPETEADDMFEVLDFALKDVALNQGGERWRGIGFNLDGLDSQGDMPQVECVPPRPTASIEIDGDDGIDNSFGHNLFPLVNLVIPGIDMTALMSEEEGLGAVLLRIRGWNGQDDDPRVDVTLAQSVLAVQGDGTDTPPEIEIRDFIPYEPGASERTPLPAWDGDDWFYARADSFVMDDEERPKIRDDNAYVSGRNLVMRLPDRVEIIFPGPEQGVSVRLTDAVAVGRISDDLENIGPVVIGGRWALNDLLETAQSVGVCAEDSEFTLLQNQLDTIADIRTTPGTGGEGVPCDAVSIGITFMGFRGHWAGLTPGQALPNVCAEGTP